MWHGCSCGHDFDFHILSWMEAATQFAHGNLHPTWAFTPSFNAGEPRFVFYPPISWTLGAVLGLVLPWTVTPIVYTWLALTAAGLGCYRLLREFAPTTTAVFIAALYIVNPYILFTAYERTAYAELLAAAWLPLLLHGVLRTRVTILGIALPMALLWLTNAPAAVIGCYGLGFLTLVRLLLHGSEGDASTQAQLATNTITGTALGIGLASFYIVPAAYQRRYVQIAMAMTDGMRITDNYLFHHTPDPDHDAVLHTASLIAVGLIAVTLMALLIAYRQGHRDPITRKTLISVGTFVLVIGLLLTPLSGPVWRHAPELAFLQFPWRFVAILTPLLAVALVLALHGVALRPARIIPAGLILAGLLTFTSYRAFHQECDEEDTVAARLSLFHTPAGSDPTDEYTPLTADNDSLSKTNPPFWLALDPTAAAPANVPAGPLHGSLDLTSPIPQTLILNLRDYPAWRVSINQQVVTTRIYRADGLIAVPLPAGHAHLEITSVRSRDQEAGWDLSLASLLVLTIPLLRRRQPR